MHHNNLSSSSSDDVNYDDDDDDNDDISFLILVEGYQRKMYFLTEQFLPSYPGLHKQW